MSKTPEEMLAIMQGTKPKPIPEKEGRTQHPSEGPQGLDEKLLAEQKRTNKLLTQIKNILIGGQLNPDHKDAES
jgi:hypothetical protein